MSLEETTADSTPEEYGHAPTSVADYPHSTPAGLPAPLQSAAPRAAHASLPINMPDQALSRFERWATQASDSQFNALAGAIGGFTSGIVTCPLDVIKTKLQAQGGINLQRGIHVGQPQMYKGLFGTASVIWRDEGLRGMYRGLGPIIMGYLPTWAVWFTVYNKSKTVIGQYHSMSASLRARLARGQLPRCPWALRALLTTRRQHHRREFLVLHRGRSQQHYRHKPNMGYQDTPHVTIWPEWRNPVFSLSQRR